MPEQLPAPHAGSPEDSSIMAWKGVAAAYADAGSGHVLKTPQGPEPATEWRGYSSAEPVAHKSAGFVSLRPRVTNGEPNSAPSFGGPAATGTSRVLLPLPSTRTFAPWGPLISTVGYPGGSSDRRKPMSTKTFEHGGDHATANSSSLAVVIIAAARSRSGVQRLGQLARALGARRSTAGLCLHRRSESVAVQAAHGAEQALQTAPAQSGLDIVLGNEQPQLCVSSPATGQGATEHESSPKTFQDHAG